MLSKHLGNPVLHIIRDNQAELGLDPEIFNLVYEGFWDLYTFKPRGDQSAKKLQQWITKINLIPTRKPAGYDGEASARDELDEEGNPLPKKPVAKTDRNFADEQVDPILPISALVRIRIPKMKPEPEFDEDGVEIPQQYDEEELEEVPFEDKCASIDTTDDNQSIWVINQAADRAIRNDLAVEMRGILDRLEAVEQSDFLQAVEREAVRFEKAFLELFEDDPESTTGAPKVPIFDFSPAI